MVASDSPGGGILQLSIRFDDLTEGDPILVIDKDGREHVGHFDRFCKTKDKSYLLSLIVSDQYGGTFTFVRTREISKIERRKAKRRTW